MQYPVMVKPRWGSASIGLSIAHNDDELVWAFNLARANVSRTFLTDLASDDSNGTVLIQEFIDGEEFGADVLNDFGGKHHCVYVKRKIGMRAGETDKATLVEDNRLTELAKRVGEISGHVGNLDMDLFATESGRVLVLEMNPRFGGGYPFSHEFGARYPSALLAWSQGDKFDVSSQRRIVDKVISKCDRLVVLGDQIIG